MNPAVAPRWMRIALILAGVYNLAWGTLVVFFPETMYAWGGMATPPGRPLVNVEVWQCVGMVVGVYGVGYILAARDPYRNWVIVLVGLLGKVFGPIGVVGAVLGGRLAWTAAVTNACNDLIWWVPFALILRGAYRSAAPPFTAPGCDSPSPARPHRPP